MNYCTLFILFILCFEANAQADFVSQSNENSNDGTTWNNTVRYLSAYNENGLVTELLQQNWDNNWTNYNLQINTYNTNGSLAQKETQYELGIPYSRMVYTYSATQKVILIEYEDWTGNSWAVKAKSESEYDDNDLLIKETSSKLDDSNTWVYTSRKLYEYDNNGNNILITSELYSASTGFYLFLISSYEYDTSSKLVVAMQKQYMDAELVKIDLRHYYYIPNTDNIDYTLTEGSVFSSPLQLSSKAQFFYYPDNRLQQILYSTWNDPSWKPYRRESFFYPNLSTSEFKKRITNRLAKPIPKHFKYQGS